MAKKKRVTKVKKAVTPNLLDEISPQVTEWVNRVGKLRKLTPVLAEAREVVKLTESRIRILRSELVDIQNKLLPGLPGDVPAETVPVPEIHIQEPGDPYVDDPGTQLPTYDMPLRNCRGLSVKTVANCQRVQLLTVGKVVEFWAGQVPFSSINGIGPAEARELQALVQPFGPMLPQIRAKLGM